jgi:hypothetical protein
MDLEGLMSAVSRGCSSLCPSRLAGIPVSARKVPLTEHGLLDATNDAA